MNAPESIEKIAVVDPRHDHSFRIPRPDLTVKLGVPNACTRCHGDKPAEWAVEQVQKWYGKPLPGHQQFAEALYAGQTEAAGARELLRALLPPRAPTTGVSGLNRGMAVLLLNSSSPWALSVNLGRWRNRSGRNKCV